MIPEKTFTFEIYRDGAMDTPGFVSRYFAENAAPVAMGIAQEV